MPLSPEPLPPELLPPEELPLLLPLPPLPFITPLLPPGPGPLVEPVELLPELLVAAAGVRFDDPLPELPQPETTTAAPTAKTDDARRKALARLAPRSGSMASPFDQGFGPTRPTVPAD